MFWLRLCLKQTKRKRWTDISAAITLYSNLINELGGRAGRGRLSVLLKDRTCKRGKQIGNVTFEKTPGEERGCAAPLFLFSFWNRCEKPWHSHRALWLMPPQFAKLLPGPKRWSCSWAALRGKLDQNGRDKIQLVNVVWEKHRIQRWVSFIDFSCQHKADQSELSCWVFFSPHSSASKGIMGKKLMIIRPASEM